LIAGPWKSCRLLGGWLSLDGSHDVGFLHDEVFDAIELDFGARSLAEEDEIAGLDIDWNELAVLIAPPGPTATTSPCMGFSWAVSGMMMPPLVLVSSSTRRTTTRSCRGRNFMGHAP
jgi:hypothetical protein